MNRLISYKINPVYPNQHINNYNKRNLIDKRKSIVKVEDGFENILNKSIEKLENNKDKS